MDGERATAPGMVRARMTRSGPVVQWAVSRASASVRGTLARTKPVSHGWRTGNRARDGSCKNDAVWPRSSVGDIVSVCESAADTRANATGEPWMANGQPRQGRFVQEWSGLAPQLSWIERPPPKGKVARSNRVGAANAREHWVRGPRGWFERHPIRLPGPSAN